MVVTCALEPRFRPNREAFLLLLLLELLSFLLAPPAAQNMIMEMRKARTEAHENP